MKIAERIIRIKELISGQVDMGTFGLIEIELFEMEKMIEKKRIKIERGDVVKLKSGGPNMTVKNIKHHFEYIATCDYFDGEGNLKSENFYVEELELVKL